MTSAGQRMHPLEALAEALVEVVYRESRRGAERGWEKERVRLEALRKESPSGPNPAEGGSRLRVR